MSVTVSNPYSGKEEETCSVSFAAQQSYANGVSTPQTEAQYNTSKLLGEWGVIKAKLAKGEIPPGTKVLSFTSPNGSRGYLSVKGGKLYQKLYTSTGKGLPEFAADPSVGDALIKASGYNVTIPQSVKGKNDTIAFPTPSSAVDAGSDSVGSMSHEDVAAMFVKIKDDLAKEKGLNIKGSNPDLDVEVYKAIGDKTGYTAAEVKGKIDAYKAAGNKLSALKKKVLAGTKKVPDPKPNGVPTKASPAVAQAIKVKVKKLAEQHPTKVYSDEDISAQYIIAKDGIVAASNGKWTLYTKSDELEDLIYKSIHDKTGYNTLQAKQAIANYLGSGKKLSVLKKQLIKQGSLDPKADTLKKSGVAKTLDDKKKDVDAKADAGYTPTSTPATTAASGEKDMPVGTGKPAPKRVAGEDQLRGEIDHISDADQLSVFSHFKSKGYGSYLSSTNEANYDAFLDAQVHFAAQGKEYTLLQLIRIVDAQGAKKVNVANAKLFEKKLATWLTTPEATAHLKAKAKKLEEAAAAAKAAEEAKKAAKLLEANQPALPADSAGYRHFSETEVMRMHEVMQAARPWTASQRAALRKYTSNAYTQMNGHLRSGKPLSADTSIKNAQDGMRPSTEPMLLHRGTGISQFGLQDEHLIWGLTGKLLEDKGFMSTSFGGRAAFGGKVLLEIEAPRGTPMAVAKGISHYSSENEVVLAAGTKYRVLRVSTEDGGWQGKRYVVRVRVEQ